MVHEHSRAGDVNLGPGEVKGHEAPNQAINMQPMWRPEMDKFAAALKKYNVNHVYFMGCLVSGIYPNSNPEGPKFMVEMATKSGAKVTAHTTNTMSDTDGKYYMYGSGPELPATITVTPNKK